MRLDSDLTQIIWTKNRRLEPLVSIPVNACSMHYSQSLQCICVSMHQMLERAMQPGQRVMQDKDLKLRSDRLKSWRAALTIANAYKVRERWKGTTKANVAGSLLFSSRATWPSLTGIPLPVTISTLCSLHLIANTTTILVLIYILESSCTHV